MSAPTVTMDKILPLKIAVGSKSLGDSRFLQFFFRLFQVIMANPGKRG